MAGYIGSKSSVTQVDGYSEAEADAEFVTKTGDTMSGNLDVTGTVTGSTGITTGVNYGNFTPVTSGTTGARISANGNGMLRFASGGVDKMYVLDSGNVGIGTSSGTAPLEISNSAANSLRIHRDFATNSASSATIRFAGDDSVGNVTDYAEIRSFTEVVTNGSEAGALLFGTRSSGSVTERMRIDSSGNVLVGKTTDAFGTAGVVMRQLGIINITRANGSVLNLNRTGNDGALAEFHKDGTTIGTIGVHGGSIVFGRGDTALAFNDSLDAIYPINTSGATRDNAIDLGRIAHRFDDIYATNGTIQTSDFNEKQDIASLTATEMLVGKRLSGLFKTFRWKDSVAENGDNARTHTGVIAQDVQAAFTAEGLDAGDYALFISSTWWETQTEVPAVEAVAEVTDEDGNVTTEAVEAKDAYTRTDTYDTEAEAPEGATERTRLGIRYPELLSFVAAYNEQRFASIEARLTALEA
jgi:hypothetical protein